MSRLTTIENDWRQRPGSIRCAEVRAALEHLGFTVRDGKRGNHKIVSHAGLPSFIGTDFDCGHGKNNIVKRSYIKKLLNVLDENREQLELM